MKELDVWESLTISNDFIFSKVMRDKEICKETLEVLLNKKIGDIKYIDNQKNIDIVYDSKSVRLDIYVEDDDRIYNVEMQVVNKKDLPKRSRYYQGMIDLNSIEKGELYNDLKDSIIIFICKFDPFKKGLPKYTFENICIENKDLYLCDGTTKVFFNTKDYEKESSEDIRSFLQYVENNDAKDRRLITKIENKIRKIKENREWRAEFMTLRLKELEIFRDAKEEGLKIGREEGIKEGRREGIRAGIKEGIKEGRKEGIKEGKAEGLREGIKKTINIMREVGVSDEIIIEKLLRDTDITREEIEEYLK